MSASEAQKRAIKKYRQNIKRITIEFCPSEQPLLERINEQKNKRTYIKRLIAEDIERDCGGNHEKAQNFKA